MNRFSARRLALALVCLIWLWPAFAHAVLMKFEYNGIIDTSGVSSSAFFRDRPTTAIAGSFTYESETSPISRSTGVGFALNDYSFTITFPDRADYVSTGITDFGLGNITVPASPPRVDLLVQGVFIGPDFALSSPTGSIFQLQDGSSASALNIPANFLSPNTLPDTPFGLDDITGGRIGLEWTNSLGGRLLANFNLTSLTAAPVVVAAVPEPEIYALMGLGLGLLGWVGRCRKLAA